MRLAILLCALAFGAPPLAVAGCGGDDAPEGGASSAKPKPPPPPSSAKPVVRDGGADGAASPTATMAPLPPPRELTEQDFAETDRSRDPFRAFGDVFVAQAKGRVTLQRQVLIERYALDELKLLGIVTRAPSRALLADPTGLGWVAKVGDFIGKPELVHAGGPTGTDVAVNWRIDRIRDDDVVFIREDPSHPEIAPTTRVVSLHPVDETGR